MQNKSEAAHCQASDCVVRVWAGYVQPGEKVNPSAFQLLLRWDLNLHGLTFLTSKIESQDELQFPLNSLVFKLRDGFYWVPPENMQEEDPKRDTSLLRIDRSKVKRSYAMSSITRIQTLQAAIIRAQNSTKSVLARTESFLQSAVAVNDIKRSIEEMRLIVKKRKQDEKVHFRKQKAAAAALKVGSNILSQQDNMVTQSHNALATCKAELAALGTKMGERRKMLWQAQNMVTVRQTRIILELSQIFPLVRSENGLYSICNLDLPNTDFSGFDEEQVATALGYVAHLTFMMSKYLEVPFRFPILPMCSRSHIKDEISTSTPDKERIYPLYSKGKERAQFDYGVFLLNKNIQQLLNHCHLRPTDPQATLPNLRSLLVHFINLHQQHVAASGAYINASAASNA